MKVYNRHHKDEPPGAIYVGRPTKWGNPFEIGKDGTREGVLIKYQTYVDQLRQTSDLFVKDLEELRGKDLVCWCVPKSCHASILLELANA